MNRLGFPDGSWRTIMGAGIGMSVGVPAMIFYTTGIFFDPIARDIGINRAQFGGAILGTTIALALCVPFVGRVVDRVGMLRPILVGAVLLAIAFAALGLLSNTPLSYMALMTAIGVLGAGVSPVPYTRAVTATFDRGRGTAIGITLTIIGLASILLPQIATLAIEAFGWRTAYLFFALLALAALPNTLLLRTAASAAAREAAVDLGSGGGDERFWRYRTFWLLLTGFTLVAVALFGFMLHIVPFATSSGLSATEAARYASLLGASGLVARFVVGALADVFAPHRVMVCCVLIAGATIALVASNIELIALAAIALGFVVGAELDLMSIITSRHYPGRLYGRVYSTLYAPTIIGTGASSLWIGAVADRFGYGPALWIGAGLGVLGGCLFLALPDPRRTAPVTVPATPTIQLAGE